MSPHRIGGVMVSVFDSSVVDPGFDPRLDQTNDYKIDISYFSSNHAAIRRRSKTDWLETSMISRVCVHFSISFRKPRMIGQNFST
jgi:hypothetical protein